MSRVVKEYAERRNEILATAQRFLTTKGFEQMTIQDILDELRISKGAFYHYFSSKQALLDALIKHILEQAMQMILPIVEDPDLPALEKLERLFAVVARWKSAQKPFMLALLRVWYEDENALVRQKQIAARLHLVGPLISRIVYQGVQEGVFNTPVPEQIGEVSLVLMTGLGDALANLLLSAEQQPGDFQRLEDTVAVYTDTIERALGAQSGSLHLFDPAILREWIIPPMDT
jgi:AcrR family transcriptional regulator